MKAEHEPTFDAAAPITDPDAARRDWRRWLLAWLAFLPMALLRAGTLAESDTFWQIRTGLIIIDQRIIPAVDPFSWTASGQPWNLNSWGFNVLIAFAYKIAGLPGTALICTFLVATAGAMALFLARRLGASPAVAGGMLFVMSPLLIEWLSARPQLIDYIAVLVLILILHRMLEQRPAARHILAISVLTIVWANLHASVLLSVAIVGAATVWVIVRRMTRGRAWWFLAALTASVACSLVNPYGIGLLRQTVQVKSASTEIIAEWQPVNIANPIQVIMIIIGVVALVVAVRKGDDVFAAALGATVIGSVVAIRILPILVLLAFPILATFASGPSVLRYLRSRRTMLTWGVAVAMVVMFGLAAESLAHFGRPDPDSYPATAAGEIPRNCQVFNSYDLGGFVILQRPDVKVSIDSRNDMYGVQRVLANERVVQGLTDPAEALVGAGCVLVPPGSALALQLTSNRDWELKFSERTAALFVRR